MAELAAEPKLRVVGITVSAAGCVTLTVRVSVPFVMDTVAVRPVVLLLAATFTLSVPSPLPEGGAPKVHQFPVFVQLAFHCVLEKTWRIS